MIRGLLRLWHTVRWLRPVQVYGRLWFRLHRPRPDLRSAPALRANAAAWQRCARASAMTGAFRFLFLGVEHELRTPGDWNRADWPKLWLYNLHYFNDLAADRAAMRADWHRALIARWTAENPPGTGNGWEPYPTSLRIVNWVKWAMAGNIPPEETAHSLAVQARWLRGRLEIHLQGNHLWANAKALVFAGVFFKGAEADIWRNEGMSMLRRELAEQVLPDGGHFERSPMYHAIVLEDVLDLLQLAQCAPSVFSEADMATLRETATRMLRWLRVMSHPDGDIAFFNDAAFGIAPNVGALTTYAEATGIRLDATPLSDLETLPGSGYVRLQAGPAVLITDVAELGPDYLPGHAHADTLSFELSWQGQRLIVNGGTSTYEAGAERVRQRGTAAHNTLMIDGQDSSEMWSSFRVARRARIVDVQVRGHSGGEAIVISAAHDGYRRLPGGPIHERCWQLASTHLTISDTVRRYAGHQAVIHFHFAPQWQVRPVADGTLEVIERGTQRPVCFIVCSKEALTEIVPFRWTPAFGCEEPGQSLIVRCPSGAELRHATEIRWGGM